MSGTFKRPAEGGLSGSRKKSKKVNLQNHGVVLFCGSNHWNSKINVKDTDKIIVTPSKVAAMAGRKIAKVVIGPAAYHGVMLTKQGTAFAFGRNDAGQLGMGDTKDRPSPRKINIGSRVIDAACGRRHTLLLLSDGTVMSMGLNTSGQLGIGSKFDKKETPTPLLFDFESKIVKVACGNDFSMVLNEGGTLFAFGHPDKGVLGNGTNGEFFVSASKLSYHFEFTPIKVTGYCDKDPDEIETSRGNKSTSIPVNDFKLVDVKCGPMHTVALTDDGRVFTWGFGGYGRLGHNTNEDEYYPRLLLHLKPSNPHTGGANAIYAGGSSCFVETKNEKQMFFWGQLKMSGEATMYPKRYDEITSVSPDVFSVGTKHVVVAAHGSTGAFSMGSSPCYGELGYGAAVEGRSSTIFKPMGPLQNVPIHHISCGISQTVIIADNSTKEARQAIQELPTIGMVETCCLICKEEDDAEGAMMLCDKCDRPCHWKCAGLACLPADDQEWFCKYCK